MCVCNQGAYADNLADAVDRLLLLVSLWSLFSGDMNDGSGKEMVAVEGVSSKNEMQNMECNDLNGK